MTYDFIGAAIGVGAGISGCEKAPEMLGIKPQDILCYEGGGRDYPVLATYFSELGEKVYQSAAQKHFPIVIGGDHSCAMGTWQGIHRYYQDFGLIWIDAHLDSHTPATTPSGNVHGMPVATLLGYGGVLGAQPKLKPENTVFIGIRSYEVAEITLLQRLNVKVYFMEEVTRRGISQVLHEAYHQLAVRAPVGFSIDMDGFDPRFVPGVGTPVPGGIDLEEFLTALQQLDLATCCGLEIAEYNPDLDRDDLTLSAVKRVISGFVRA